MSRLHTQLQFADIVLLRHHHQTNEGIITHTVDSLHFELSLSIWFCCPDADIVCCANIYTCSERFKVNMLLALS
jgi:hypothetical protein